MIKKVCAFCNGEYHRKPSESKESLYCSHKCASLAKSTNPGKIWSVVECSHCHNKFSRRTYRIKDAKHIFCSRACCVLYAKEHSPDYHVTLVCQICGNEFSRARYFVNVRKDAKFCSRACLDKHNSHNKRREKNVNWRGGQGVKDYGPDWSYQNKLARKRDGNKCQLCKADKRPWMLDVHHIVSIRSFGYISGQNENYKQANRLENLITLCKKCHRKVEVKPYLLRWFNPAPAP